MYEYNARVRKIEDGSTIYLNVDLGFNITLNNLKFRLHNYSMPRIQGDEKYLGIRAKRKLFELVPLNRLVKIRVHGSDKFGNHFGDIILPDGQTLTEFLIKLGYGVYWDKTKERYKWDPKAPYPDSSLAEKAKVE